MLRYAFPDLSRRDSGIARGNEQRLYAAVFEIEFCHSALVFKVLRGAHASYDIFYIIFPHIDTKEQAVHAVNEVKFAPVGHRGFGDSARASEFGYIPTEEFLPYVNKNVLAIGMIESQKGIDNLDDILTSGIDVLRVGAKDLSLDMGDGGVVTPRVREAVKKICRKVRDSNVMLGDAGLGGLKDEADFKECIELGCRMFTLGSDMALVKKLLTKGLDNFNQLKKSLA